MSKITIDLTNYRDRRGARVPEGKYRVQVEDIEMGTTRNHDPMLTVYLRIMGGEHDSMTILDRLTLNEKAMFRMVGFMQALGMPTPKKKLAIDTSKFVGQTVDIVVRDGEPYQGTVRSEVGDYVQIPRKAKKAAQPEIEDVEDDSDEVESPWEEPAAEDSGDGSEIDFDDLDEDDL